MKCIKFKIAWIIVSLFMLNGLCAQAQSITVKGTVTDASGETLPGVNILVQGTTTGAVTDIDGAYSITIPSSSAVLQFSSIGYVAQSVTVGGQTVINVVMQEDVKQLEEVVVTALGIEKRSKGLAYSTQKVSSEELTGVKDPSMMNTLAGKVAGVNITKSTTLGGTSKVVIRGNKSIQGNNQPLYVIDGIPISNTSPSQGEGGYGGARDGGDGISNLNPEDIESMSVLKGAAAAALYGSQAANGVIVITTKKGKVGSSKVDFSSSYTYDVVNQMLDFQNSYGRSSDKESWGEKANISDSHIEDFFRPANTWINAISLSSGSEKAQFFASYSNTTANGTTPNYDYDKNTFNVRGTGKAFNDRLTVDGRMNYMRQNVKNRPQPGTYMNPLTGLYMYPRGAWNNDYKDNYEIWWPDRQLMGQNWDSSLLNDDTMQNPYWVANRITSSDIRDRYIGSMSAKLDITKYLNLQGRVSMDKIVDEYERKIYATTATQWAPGGKGRYTYYNGNESQTYADMMANFNKKFNDINVVATVGTSITDYKTTKVNIDSDKNSLYYANIFTLTNIANGGSIRDRKPEHRQLQSVFGTAQIGYKDYLFLDLTARNDWSSTVSSSYFYPSVGLTAVLSDMISLPEMFDYAKVRTSWTQVGNDMPIYITNPMDEMLPNGDIKPNTKKPFTEMKPEISTSLEAGVEFSLFRNALNVDATFYKTNSKNQYFELPAPSGTGYTTYYVNAGNVQNMGFELMLTANPFWRGDFKWRTMVNMSANKNKVIELAPGLDYFNFSSSGFSIRCVPGQEWGDIYAQTVEKAPDGSIYVDEKGVPILTASGNEQKVGNINPDLMLGFNNQMSYKAFTLGFLIDCRFGGNIVSATQAKLDRLGVTQVTADARDNGLGLNATVKSTGTVYTKEIDPKVYYTTTASATGEYVYSATNVRLREVSLAYTFPKTVISGDRFIKNLQLSLVGRNLFFFYVDAPFDPDYTVNNKNTFQATDDFGLPATRSFGVTLNASF